jgi:transposase
MAQKTCVKIHETRARKKRDVALRDHQVELILSNRRFRCLSCKKRFTEPDTACGKKRRTTKRFRELIGKQASIQPVAPVAKTCGVSHHVVHHGFEVVATQEIERKGLAVKADQPLPTPRFLGIDEFATRKGHRSDTMVGDLEARQVGEVSAGRKLEDVAALLERLCDPDAVKAVRMDRSASFRPAVHLCLPKAHIVVDHLHVIHQVMKGLQKVLSSWAHQKEGKPLLEGRQQLFLKAKEDVTEKQAKERTHLGELLPWLETAWHLKEEVRPW